MPLDIYENQKRVPLDIYVAKKPLDIYAPKEPEVTPPSILSRAKETGKDIFQVLGTLPAAGFTYMLSLIGGASVMLPKEGISEEAGQQLAEDIMAGKIPEDQRTFMQRAEEAGKLSEETQAAATYGLRPGAQKIMEKIAIPFEMVDVAKTYWGNLASNKFGPEIGVSVGKAFELVAFFGLPKLASSLKTNIKTGKIEAVKQNLREIHKAQLVELIREPNRLEHLAAMERKIAGENITFKESMADKADVELGLRIVDATKSRLEKITGVKPRSIKEQKTFQAIRESIEKEQAINEQVKQDLLKFNSGPTTFSMLGTQNAYELIAKQKDLFNKIYDTIDVEAKWKRMNAPEVGFAFKNIMSRRSVMEELGAHEVAENARLFNYDQLKAPDVILAAENSSLIRPDIQDAVNHLLDFQESIRHEYQKRGIKLDFKERIKNEILELIDTAESAQDIANLRQALKTVDQINFVHIPSAYWFEQYLGRDPAGASRALKLVATQKRKNLTIKSLIDKEILRREQLHPGDIIGSYARRAGKDFAILDLRDAAIKDGLAFHNKNPKLPDTFVDAPRSAYVFKGYKIHPALADAIDSMMRFSEGRTNFDKTIAITKMAAFYNPLFLPMYDVIQGAMLGSSTSIKMPLHLAKAIKDVWKMTPDYIEALNNGLASKPFNNPARSYIDMINWAKMSKKQKFIRGLESVYPKNWFKSIYTPAWVTAWKMDETIRMMSYNYLKSKGFTPRDAAQTAAMFHADYASVPAPTRRLLNRIFFTPTFKITMGKLYVNMMKGAIESTVKLGRVDRTTRVLGKGLALTAIVSFGFDMFMTANGWKRDEFARRYTKTVETEKGPKELVFVFSTPMNMWQKYYYRAKSASQDVQNPMGKFLDYNRWEFHPLWRTTYDIVIKNDNGLGDKIYSTFDEWPIKIGKSLKYGFENVIRITNAFDQEPSVKEAQEKFAKETSRTIDLLTRPFAFKYMRSDIDQRTYYRYKKLTDEFKTEMSRHIKKQEDGEINQRWLDNYLKQVDEIMTQYEKDKESQ